jgi:hypothetical protein
VLVHEVVGQRVTVLAEEVDVVPLAYQGAAQVLHVDIAPVPVSMYPWVMSSLTMDSPIRAYLYPSVFGLPQRTLTQRCAPGLRAQAGTHGPPASTSLAKSPGTGAFGSRAK